MQALPNSRNEIISFLRELPKDAGIYKFIGEKKIPIYIGKAKNIKNRVGSYFQLSGRTEKVINLVKDAKFLEITVTSTELEALLLEQFLIKEFKPKYNVQFKDDKGYPWIKLETSSDFPSAKSYLGKKDDKETYFGPYPNSYAVRDTLGLIQKTFKLRNCSDSFFKNRNRPCLQYQIEKCSAPCVGLISKEDYLQDVKATSMLLEGKSEDLITDLYSSMDLHSKNQSYEKAGFYRDKISALRDIQRSQSISGFSKERDALYLATVNGNTRIGITHVHKGWITGHENYIQETEGLEESVFETFIKRYYLSNNYCPQSLVIGQELINKKETEEALSEYHNKRVRIISKSNQKDKGLLEITKSNTILASRRKSKDTKDLSSIFGALKKQLYFKKDIRVIESYDISHHSGSGAVGGCVVYGEEGKVKEKYRLFNISKDNAGDDIASMKEVINRRFKNKDIGLSKPSLIIIDGGRNHLNAVRSTLIELELGLDDIELLSISKGARRKAEMDSIHTLENRVIRIKKGSISHLFIQEVRDETHRFSILNQKNKQSKLLMRSTLDNINGLGINKKKVLLRYFGSLEQVKRASYSDLMNVSGIGPKIASLIYNELH